MKVNFDDYRDNDVEEKEKFLDERLSKLSIHQSLKQIHLNDLLVDFDATSLYPNAM